MHPPCKEQQAGTKQKRTDGKKLAEHGGRLVNQAQAARSKAGEMGAHSPDDAPRPVVFSTAPGTA
ncbi:hypothetical protein GCM10011319_50820 [Mameliella alba]|nr:hypothetical protein GCM10011319_50820 [Mameliella alba]